MQFLYPTFLYALLALAIPIIIHLFFFRRFKKVYFTNVRFLKEVKEETSARRRLRNLLVLLSRLLALAALIFAFAQPFIPKDSAVKQGEQTVSVFIDNSFSMSALSEDVPLMEKAKQRARQIVSAYAAEDRFQILTNDFEGRHQQLISKEDALELIDEITISPSVKEMSKVISRQQQSMSTGGTDNQTAYLISDFQKNTTDLNNYKDTLFDVNLVPLQSVQEKNISIDSCWFDAPVRMLNQTNSLVVKIKNHSDEAVDNIRLAVHYDGQTKPVGTLSIPARSSVTDTVNITILKTGWHEAELNITDYPVQFDDKYFFTFNVAEEINVLVINGGQPNKYLDAAFAGVSFFKVVNENTNSLNYAAFRDYELIITNGLQTVSSGLAAELNQYAVNGGNVLVFPAATAVLDSYRSFLNGFRANELQAFEKLPREVSNINTEEFVFKDVYENSSKNLKLPVTQGNFKISSNSSRAEEALLTYRDGSTYLAKYENNKGHLYLCAAPLDEDLNNLVRSGEIFIPMLYKMAVSTAKDQQIAYIIGRDELIEADNKINSSELVYKMKGSAEEFIPSQKIIGPKVLLGVNNQVTESGYYNLFLNEGEVLAKYAFNYDRKESDLAYLNTNDLESFANPRVNVIAANSSADLTPLIGERSKGVVLWRWFLIAALCFLIVEVLLLRLWRV
jgi:Aerotolerance regulator N-terminal